MNNFNKTRNWIDDRKYQYSKEVILYEKEKEGKAELKFISENNLFAISLSHKNKISVFKHQKVADWIVLEFLDDDYVNLHLIELKRTISTGRWQEIKEQLKGAYEHSFLLKGLFDYKINKIFCYSAYINDKFGNVENTANPVLLKNSVGNRSQTSAIDWNKNKISIHDLSVSHIKIKLKLDKNNIGQGSYKCNHGDGSCGPGYNG